MTEITLQQKKDWAKLLYTSEGLSQKEIAQRVGVSEKTIVGWKDKYGWEELKKSLLATREENIALLYDALSDLLANKDKKTTKLADEAVKLTTAIKNLESETGLGEVIQIGQRFINFIRANDLVKAKEVLILFDAFVQDIINKSRRV